MKFSDVYINNFCPVCGYDLEVKAWEDEESPSDDICASCGIHFGYTDMVPASLEGRYRIYVEFRQQWIDRGMPWHGPEHQKPQSWDPRKQLDNINVHLD